MADVAIVTNPDEKDAHIRAQEYRAAADRCSGIPDGNTYALLAIEARLEQITQRLTSRS